MDVVNDREWANEANWHLGHSIYFAPRDSRVLVPKWHEPRMSHTLNFARGQTYFILLLLFAAPAVMLGLLVTR